MSIHIFGLGANGLGSLSADAQAALSTCQTVFGGGRHLDLIPEGPTKQLWPRPWRVPFEEIRAAKGPVGLLVSGDPCWYSAGPALRAALPQARIWPTPGAFSLAAAHLGWALEQVTLETLHGRGPDQARAAAAHISAVGGRHLLLADRQSLRAFVGALQALAFTPVTALTLLRDLGTQQEACFTLDLDAPVWPDTDLFTIALDLAPQARLLLDADFLPDSAFESHGKITKAAARASAVAQLRAASVLWDVGAGAGTVGLQAAYTLQADALYLIEDDPEALKILERNCANSSAPAVVVAGRAPQVCADLPAPDAVFIGGGLRDPAVLTHCWTVLRAGGRLVAHAVTLESERTLLDAFADYNNAELTRLAVSTAEPVGPFNGWRPAMPLTQLVLEKP